MTTEQSAYDIATRFQNHEDWHHSPREPEPDLELLESDPQLEQYGGYTEFEHSDTGATLMLPANNTLGEETGPVATAGLCQPLDPELDIQYQDDFQDDGFFADLLEAYQEIEDRHGTEYTGTREPDSSVIMGGAFPEGYDPGTVDRTVEAFSEVSTEVESLHQDLRSTVSRLSGGADNGSR